jgi:hypothetical protein
MNESDIDPKEQQRQQSRHSLANRLEAKAARLESFGPNKRVDSLREEAAELRLRKGRKTKNRDRHLVNDPKEYHSTPRIQPDGQLHEVGYGHAV